MTSILKVMKASVPTANPPEMSISVATPISPVGDMAETPSEAAVTTAPVMAAS